MVIKEHQLESILKNNKKFLNFLIYGPNDGLISDQISKILNVFVEKLEFEKINITDKELDKDPELLDEIVKTVSMFSKGKVIIIESLKEKQLHIIESAINEEPTDTVLILKSQNLIKSSKIRKLYENQNKYYSLPCYEDDTRSLMRQIEEFTKKNNLTFDQEIKNYLLQVLSSDRMVSIQELEKINLLSNNSKDKLQIEDIRIILNDSSSKNLNKMNESVMYGYTEKSSSILSKLLSEGDNPINIVRSLMNYLKRIHQTKIEMKKGYSFDESIKGLRPPVFWKDKDNFQRHCFKWPLYKIEHTLSKLLETEVACKRNNKLAKINCERSILQVANNGKQYFKN